MRSPVGRLGSAVASWVLAMGPSTGCGDDLPEVVADGGTTASSSSSTGASTTMPTSADTTAGTLDGTGTTAGTSSGEPTSSSETTQGVSTTEAGTSSSDGTTTDGTTMGTTMGSSTDGTTTDATTSGATTDMTGGTTFGGTTDMTGGTTDATGGTTDQTGSTGVDTDTIEEVPDFSGDFLMALATSLDPTLPFQYVASFDFVPSGLGGGTVDVELQPLALDTGSTTTPRTFFGPPLVFPALPVTSDGTFAIPVGVLNVAAETNPLFFVDAQANNVVISAQVLDADDLCGTADGLLVFPIAAPLTGTTFAAVRVADIMPPGLPVVFPVACP